MVEAPARTNHIYCSHYQNIDDGRTFANTPDKSIYNGAGHDLIVIDNTYKNSTAEEFKVAMSGVMAVYPLENSVHYQLSAPQVRTLLGLNHIWASTGDIESITYPVDTGTALDNQTTAMQGMIAGSDSQIATESHAVGDVFICNNKLYKATATIAVGESIIEGSNVVVTSVAEMLLNKPDFVKHISRANGQSVTVTMKHLSRAIVFATGADTTRNGMIFLFCGSANAYAYNVTPGFTGLSVAVSGMTVTITNVGSGLEYIDVLRLYGEVN